MEYKDYYKTLGVAKGASADEIKHAYRRLARKYHPDVSKEKNAEDQFKNVQEAYEVLKDPEKRKAYDELGSNWKAGQDFRPPPGWQGGTHFHRGGGGFSEADMGGFSDFFSDLFGGRMGGGQGGFSRAGHRGRAGAQGFGGDEFEGFQQRGNDQHAKIAIPLEDAFKGTTRTFQLQMPELDSQGRMHNAVRTLKVTIPAGAKSGQKLRLAKQGAPGMGGAPAGDLYLEIEVEPHAMFTLKDNDIYLTLPITPWEAALGADIKVPTLGGVVGMKLAPGSQSGQKLRLKGRGMPGKPHAGDQYAVLQIETPPAHTDEQRKLYQTMSDTMPFNPRKDWIM